MHMADALLSPAVGGVMWAVTGGVTVIASRRLRAQQAEAMAPMMAVLGAFVFAAQMINFAIPGTGSSGHLGGGLLLAILLGPHAAFLTLTSVLTVQALFFADGGLLALGCTIFNLGVFPCYIAYPLIYRPLAGDGLRRWRRTAACFVAAILGIAMGATGVVVETYLSGISELPFVTFIVLMLPIHLAIGLAEGGVTAALTGFIARAQPELLTVARLGDARASYRGVALSLLAAALLTGGILSWFASERPDGLEWSIEKITGKTKIDGDDSDLRRSLSALQYTLSFLPDYEFRPDETAARPVDDKSLPKPEKSLAGLLGAGITLLLAGGIGFFLRWRRHRSTNANDPSV